ncbi:MAG: hypothetical protein ACREAA_02525 [Candidatus Polarisedimenticolia bacterium]
MGKLRTIASAALVFVLLGPAIGTLMTVGFESLAQYFREVGAVVNAGGPPDRAKLLAVMSRFRLVPAPPK